MTHVSTVTIPLEEYNNLKDAFQTLQKFKEQDENHIVIRGPYGNWYSLTKAEFIIKTANAINNQADKIDNLTKELVEQKLIKRPFWRIF